MQFADKNHNDLITIINHLILGTYSKETPCFISKSETNEWVVVPNEVGFDSFIIGYWRENSILASYVFNYSLSSGALNFTNVHRYACIGYGDSTLEKIEDVFRSLINIKSLSGSIAFKHYDQDGTINWLTKRHSYFLKEDVCIKQFYPI